jgi:hypothetical protein
MWPGCEDRSIGLRLLQLRRRFGERRRIVVYMPTRSDPAVQAEFVEPFQLPIEEYPSFPVMSPRRRSLA